MGGTWRVGVASGKVKGSKPRGGENPDPEGTNHVTITREFEPWSNRTPEQRKADQDTWDRLRRGRGTGGESE